MNIKTKFAPGDEVIVIYVDDRWPDVVNVRKDKIAYITVDKVDDKFVVEYNMAGDYEAYSEDELIEAGDYAAVNDKLRKMI